MRIGEAIVVSVKLDEEDFEKVKSQLSEINNLRKQSVASIIHDADQIAGRCDPSYREAAFLKAVDLLTGEE